MVGLNMPFWLSIACLSIFQGALVALPARLELPALRQLRAGGWAAVLPLSILAFVLLARGAEQASAQGLTYLALIAVPPLAALALAGLARGGRPRNAVVAAALFGLAWADRGGLAGNGAATVLSGLSCVALGSLLGAITPRRWLAAGIVAMALADTALVVSDLLQAPNDALNAARPAAGLPRLQSATFGSAVMGYGDLFAAAVLGGMLAAEGARRGVAATLAAALALAFDLLFFAVHELPATVPIALTLCVLEISRPRRRTGRRCASPNRPAADRDARPGSPRPARAARPRARPASRSSAP
jgi:hypothetical protein